MVREIFSVADASLICRIPLSRQTIPDKLIWTDSPIGKFSVKSAYFVARKVLGKEVYQQTQRHKEWGFLWRAMVIPKIKHFVWRLVYGILPLGSQLHRKGITVENFCAVCGQSGETLRHTFLDCKFSLEVWRSWLPDLTSIWNELWNVTDFWSRLFEWLVGKSQLEMWMLLVWIIWNNRNSCFHNLSCRRHSNIVGTAARMKNDFFSAGATQRFDNQNTRAEWQMPLSDTVKMNVDAAFCSVTKVATLGMVFRDCTGSICLAAVKKIENVESPLHAEFLAILFGFEVIISDFF